MPSTYTSDFDVIQAYTQKYAPIDLYTGDIPDNLQWHELRRVHFAAHSMLCIISNLLSRLKSEKENTISVVEDALRKLKT